MAKRSIGLVIILITVLQFAGCSDGGPSSGEEHVVLEEGDRVFIVDQTGKKWDVTHARDEYGMQPSKFQFGLGPFGIRPILNPKMLTPASAGYPEDDERFLVLGTDFRGDSRAYPITTMSFVEVADEVFGNVHVAVAY